MAAVSYSCPMSATHPQIVLPLNWPHSKYFTGMHSTATVLIRTEVTASQNSSATPLARSPLRLLKGAILTFLRASLRRCQALSNSVELLLCIGGSWGADRLDYPIAKAPSNAVKIVDI